MLTQNKVLLIIVHLYYLSMASDVINDYENFQKSNFFFNNKNNVFLQYVSDDCDIVARDDLDIFGYIR